MAWAELPRQCHAGDDEMRHLTRDMQGALPQGQLLQASGRQIPLLQQPLLDLGRILPMLAAHDTNVQSDRVPGHRKLQDWQLAFTMQIQPVWERVGMCAAR